MAIRPGAKLAKKYAPKGQTKDSYDTCDAGLFIALSSRKPVIRVQNGNLILDKGDRQTSHYVSFINTSSWLALPGNPEFMS